MSIQSDNAFPLTVSTNDFLFFGHPKSVKMWRSKIKIRGDQYVFTDQGFNYAEKIDLRTGLPIKNHITWNCVLQKIFTIHGGIMNIDNVTVHRDSSFSLNVHHLLDCTVKFTVKAKLDTETGMIEFLIPHEIDECSSQCSLQR